MDEQAPMVVVRSTDGTPLQLSRVEFEGETMVVYVSIQSTMVLWREILRKGGCVTVRQGESDDKED